MLKELTGGDHICYPTAECAIFHHVIVMKVIDKNTVEVVSLKRAAGKKLEEQALKERVDLEKCITLGYIYRVIYGNCDKCFSADDVIRRAEDITQTMIFKHKVYNVFKNNSEHFATWCKTGEAFSVSLRQNGTNVEQHRNTATNAKGADVCMALE